MALFTGAWQRYATLLLVTVSWLLAMRLGGAETEVSRWISSLGLVAVTVAAGIACLLRAARSALTRRSFLLLGCGALAWGAGQAAWTVYESVQGREVPFPSAADAGYLLAVPFLAAGLLALPSAATALSTRVRLLLDGAIVALSLGMVSWELVLADTLAASDGTPLATFISLSYPIGDAVCGTVALVALARARHGSPVPVPVLLLLAGGCVAFAIGDSGFAFLTLRDGYYSGHLIDAGWFVGFSLLGLAACVAQVPDAPEDHSSPRGARVGLIAPYVAVVAALAADVQRQLTHGRLGPALAWSTMVLVAMLVLRQVLALAENAALTRGLEARVEERTAELAGQERWFRNLVQNLSDVVTVVDPSGVLTYVTPSSERHFGRSPSSMHGTGLPAWWSPLDAVRLQGLLLDMAGAPGETRVFAGEVVHAEGHPVPVEATVTRLDDDQAVRGFVLNVRDVTERRGFERELAHQAFHDGLTGLANRTLFADRVAGAMARTARSGRTLAVLFLDLDGFKAINDTLGHAAGDELLQQVADRLRQGVRTGDTVARLGGDEFAVLLEDLAHDEDGSEGAARVAAALRAPVLLQGREVQVRSSCGIAVYSGDESADDLLRNADLAMYRAKGVRDGGFAMYEPGMYDELVDRLRLEDDLRQSLARDELEVWYQPTLALSDHEWVGCEALVRWRHPVRGLVNPVDFISVAEETGLIVEIGAWVLREACRQTSAWRRETPGASALGVAVNVSAHQLTDDGFLDIVDAALADSGLPAHRLTIELTENVLVEHTDRMLELLVALKQRGIRLAIDDFGTGYSSLAYLHRFPVDVLKVDRSFVSGMVAGSDEEELTRSIVRLGQSLGLVVVAEGIELSGELQALQEMGCDLGQGFLFSRPVPPTGLSDHGFHGRQEVPRTAPAVPLPRGPEPSPAEARTPG